jgi:hypothetical protein
MSDTGLLAASEPAVEGTLTGDQQAEQRVRNQLRLRPDAVAVNQVLKKIAILEHCRPFDRDDCVRPELQPRPPGLPPEEEVSDEELSGPEAQESDDLGTSFGASAEWGLSLEVHGEKTGDRKSILEAYERKKAKYKDLANTLRERFGRQGWKVQVLPWVVGVRGVLHVEGIEQAMAFMEVPAAKRKGLLRKSAVASVEALEYLHRVRRSGKDRVRNRVMGEVSERRHKRKREGGDPAQCLDRWRRLVTDPMRASFLGRQAGRVLA